MKSSHQASRALSQKEVPCPLTSAPLEAARKSDIQINSASPRNTGRNENRWPQTGCLIRPHTASCQWWKLLFYFTLWSPVQQTGGGTFFMTFCLCSRVGAAFSASPCSLRTTVINAHAPCPWPEAAPWQVQGFIAIPVPLTASPAAPRPAASSWAPRGRPACFLHSGPSWVRSLLIGDNSPSSKM